MSLPRVFVDLDDTLADCDGYYRLVFGVDNHRDDRSQAKVEQFWSNVRTHGKFFSSLPIFKYSIGFWMSLQDIGANPTILTAIPNEAHCPDAADQKRDWVRRHLGTAPIICCRGKDKRLHGQPGDILVDDWDHNRASWEKMGGIFILHTGAESSLAHVAAHLELARRRDLVQAYVDRFIDLTNTRKSSIAAFEILAREWIDTQRDTKAG